MMIVYQIGDKEHPLKTVSEANVREHWARRAKRAKAQREMATLVTQSAAAGMLGKHEMATITLVRISPSARLLDTDNLARSLKAVRDGVADGLKVDDGDPRVVWKYGQQKQPKTWAVKVMIET